MKLLPLDAQKFLKDNTQYGIDSKIEMPFYPGYSISTGGIEHTREDICLFKIKNKHNSVSTKDELFVVWNSEKGLGYQKIETKDLEKTGSIDITINSVIEHGESLIVGLDYQINKGIIGGDYKHPLQIKIPMQRMGILKQYTGI